jgi:hypothetical protein
VFSIAVIAWVAGCIVVPDQRRTPKQDPWESPPPAQPAMHLPTGPAAPPADPFATAECPADLSLAAGPRNIDGRDPHKTMRVAYAKEHLKLVTQDQLVLQQDAVARVLELEAKTPGLVPAGFRDRIAKHARDPKFRMYMARCELERPETIRRAGHDAALAYLLGANVKEVFPLVEKSLYPDGTTSMSCSRSADCGELTCDSVTRSCSSSTARTASFMSQAELDVEDTLVRTFATMLTPEMIENTRYERGNIINTWVYGRFTKCSGVLCNFTRYSVRGKTQLVHWDRRYRGETYDGGATPASKICSQETQAVDRESCVYRCGTGAKSKEAACITHCHANCR